LLSPLIISFTHPLTYPKVWAPVPEGTEARFPVNHCPSNAEAINGSPQEQNKLIFLKNYREAIPQFCFLHFDF